MRFVMIALALLATTAVADEWPQDFAREGECAVCALRGANHGAERLVDVRTVDDTHYGFCSENCAAAFDQMPEGYTTPVLPRPAPSFAWTTLDGASITATGQSALLVDFWATWCAPCVKAMPELERLASAYEDQGFRVVGVSIDEKRKTLDAFVAKRPIDYAIVHDGGDDPAWWQFRVPAIPAAFLLDGDGNVVAQWKGAIDVDELEGHLESMLHAD